MNPTTREQLIVTRTANTLAEVLTHAQTEHDILLSDVRSLKTCLQELELAFSLKRDWITNTFSFPGEAQQ